MACGQPMVQQRRNVVQRRFVKEIVPIHAGSLFQSSGYCPFRISPEEGNEQFIGSGSIHLITSVRQIVNGIAGPGFHMFHHNEAALCGCPPSLIFPSFST
jgi:hypothetical protein